MPSLHEERWDKIYHKHHPQDLPWELGKARESLVKLVNSGRVRPGKALDLCCGAGSNTVYLAEKGFSVTTLDISDKAVFCANDKAGKAEVSINFLIGNFTGLPFKTHEFNFAFDFGCFHHVRTEERTTYIKGVYRVLKPKATCFLVCFSYRNGIAWNYFRKSQIQKLFQDWFKIEEIDHVSSVEGDGITRYFYQVLMQRLSGDTT